LDQGTFNERPREVSIYNQYLYYFSGPMHFLFLDYESYGDHKLTTDVEVKPFSMMSYLHSDPHIVKYQWIEEI